LRVRLTREQQRQCLRRLRRDQLLRHLRRDRDAARALRPSARRACAGGLAGGQEDCPRFCGHLPHRRWDVRRAARRRHRADGRPDDLPGAHARADRRGADGLMRRDLRSAVVVIVLATLVFGFVYPAVMTGFAQVAFENKADGSLIERNGKVVGSRLAGQEFKSANYFHERPSATSPAYNAGATTFANLGPTNPDLAKNVKAAADAILKLEGPYNPGLKIGDIPVDAVTTSGSGIDPHISPAYATLQSKRIAAVRHLPLATVQRLIDQNTDGRSLGFLGEPGVNVLKLNLALDKEQGS